MSTLNAANAESGEPYRKRAGRVLPTLSMPLGYGRLLPTCCLTWKTSPALIIPSTFTS